MTSPRVINPDCIDNDAWWDIEALKLAVINPKQFSSYRDNRWTVLVGHGSRGLAYLCLLDAEQGELFENIMNRSFNQARVNNFGDQLIAACKRVSQTNFPQPKGNTHDE